MEIIIAVVSAIIGLFIYNRVQKSKADSGQRELEIKAAVIEEKVDNLQNAVKESQKEEAKDVKQIENEQGKNLSGQSLVDFFTGRNRSK